MENSWFTDILQFHVYGKQHIGKKPSIPDAETIALRKRLIKEEVVEETLTAIEDNNIEKIADGITDSIVVLIGTAIAYGIDLEAVWNEIHKSNMDKFRTGIVKDSGGKITKPEGWQPPAVKMILEDQDSLSEIYPEAKHKGTKWTGCGVSGCPYRALSYLPNENGNSTNNGRHYDPYCKKHARLSTGGSPCQIPHNSQTSTQTSQKKRIDPEQ